MMRAVAPEKLGVAFVMSLALGACSAEQVRTSETRVPAPLPSPAQPSKSLSEIDLAKIGHIAPKGRVQDKDYNQLEVIDQLLAHGEQSIPFLIAKLDDRTVINGSVFDFRQKTSVGDVAFVILSDFSTDAESKHTIPGSSWGELFGPLPGPDVPTPMWEYLDEQFARHGRKQVKAKWKRIWTTWQDQIFWDEKERCFNVSLIKY
jgi:hypothetical protein